MGLDWLRYGKARSSKGKERLRIEQCSRAKAKSSSVKRWRREGLRWNGEERLRTATEGKA
nr:MAG TPA_asm: hypothetical protein [Bacteriophage sp.]